MTTTSTSEPESMKGSCLCGAISYTVTGKPMFSCICYCTDCKKVAGSAFIAILGFTKENFIIHNPEQAITHIGMNHAKSARDTDKSQGFCTKCGSVVFGGEYGKNPWHTVYRGTLDEEFRDCYPPTIAMFTKDSPKWGKLEGLEEFPMMPPQ
jgi:hypothetical protein